MSEIKNFSTAVFLVNEAARCIMCSYTPDDNDKTCKPKMFKTVDQSIKVGEYVVVPTESRHKMTVVKVVETDVSFDIDWEGEMDAVICKVDRSAYEEFLAAEAEMIATLKKNKEIEKRKALAASLISNEADLKGLKLAQIGAPALPSS